MFLWGSYLVIAPIAQADMVKPMRCPEHNSVQSLSCVVLASDGAWVSWLTTRKQNHIPCKLSIRNSKLTKPWSLFKGFFFKANVFRCPPRRGGLRIRRWGFRLHLLLEEWSREHGRQQGPTSNRSKEHQEDSRWEGSLEDSTSTPGRASFTADQVFNISVDWDTTFWRKLLQHLIRLLVKNFIPTTQWEPPCCILWPLPLGLLLSNFERSLALPSLLPSPSQLRTAIRSALILFSSGPNIPSSLSPPSYVMHSSPLHRSILFKINNVISLLQRSEIATLGCHPVHFNDKMMAF